jgi:hypothetical protein
MNLKHISLSSLYFDSVKVKREHNWAFLGRALVAVKLGHICSLSKNESLRVGGKRWRLLDLQDRRCSSISFATTAYDMAPI